ncbi:MAG: selenide, water dikinase SelD [Acetobacteraceae bacterium]|nr:selenide, water dikinase SelD [Acetobacteraceae bacterium]
MADFETRLTSLAHGGGCGCKLSPAVLRDLLGAMPASAPFADLLVGTETGDDAAVYRLNDQQALVATTDFFTPIVDDPFDFGRIAATNALSDVYAMGGRPILALAILGMPLGKIAPEAVRAILAGGAAVCASAGIPVAGGHSIDSPEPIYGLVALGLVRPDRLLRNSGGRDGDALLLTKGLGVGVISAALKQATLDPQLLAGLYQTLLASTTLLNTAGADLAEHGGVHAVTDVTGFGLLGHALEMCRGAGLGAEISVSAVPVLPGVEPLARAGVRTGAAGRNWASYGDAITASPDLQPWQRDLLCDPQTSGGLLIAAAPETVPDLLRRLRPSAARTAVIGHLRLGPPQVTLTP